MVKLLIAIVIIHGLKLDYAFLWYIAVGVAGMIDMYVMAGLAYKEGSLGESNTGA